MAKEREELDLPSLLKAIRKDASYVKFKEIVETAQARLDVERDRRECFAIHAGRTARTLHGKKAYNPSSIQEAEGKEIEARSRLVEIRMKAAYQLEHVEKACKAVEDHVLTEYNEEMRGYSNQDQRRALIRRVQKVAQNVLTDGKSLLDLCDRFIEDIDKVGYGLTNLTNLAVKILAGRAN